MNTSPPIPQGRYLSAARHADLIYTSGMTPRVNGELQYTGPVSADDSLEDHRAAVELAASNAITAAEGLLKDGESIARILQLQVFINAQQGFTDHAALADFASHKIADQLGSGCIGSRAAIGVATLPGDAPVEITIVAVASMN
jgi:enamine deaminase RidA (YjgF/YER057c/UK114 family)